MHRISILAPPRGATRYIEILKSHFGVFQFSPLREGRLYPLVQGVYLNQISILAPPRGATHHSA